MLVTAARAASGNDRWGHFRAAPRCRRSPPASSSALSPPSSRRVCPHRVREAAEDAHGGIASDDAPRRLAARAGNNLCKYSFGNSTFDISPLSVSSLCVAPARASPPTLRTRPINPAPPPPPRSYPVQDSRNNPGSTNYTYLFNFCQNVAYLPYAECATTYPGTGGGTFPVNTSSPAFQYANILTQPVDKCHRLGGPVSPSTMTWGLYGEAPLPGRLRVSLSHPCTRCHLPLAPADPTNPSRGIFVQYTGGDRCPGTTVYRSLKIWLLCYNDATNIPDEEVVLETSSCAYEIFVKSAFGCPIQCPLPAVSSGVRPVRRQSAVRVTEADRSSCSPHSRRARPARGRFAATTAYVTTMQCWVILAASATPATRATIAGKLAAVQRQRACPLSAVSWSACPSSLRWCSASCASHSPGVRRACGRTSRQVPRARARFVCRGYLWFFKISRLRLDPSAYSALRAGPTADDLATSSASSSSSGGAGAIN